MPGAASPCPSHRRALKLQATYDPTSGNGMNKTDKKPTIAQLCAPAQRTVDRIDALMTGVAISADAAQDSWSSTTNLTRHGTTTLPVLARLAHFPLLLWHMTERQVATGNLGLPNNPSQKLFDYAANSSAVSIIRNFLKFLPIDTHAMALNRYKNALCNSLPHPHNPVNGGRIGQ